VKQKQGAIPAKVLWRGFLFQLHNPAEKQGSFGLSGVKLLKGLNSSMSSKAKKLAGKI